MLNTVDESTGSFKSHFVTGAETSRAGQRRVLREERSGPSWCPVWCQAAGGSRSRAKQYEFKRGATSLSHGRRGPYARHLAGARIGAWEAGVLLRGADTPHPPGSSSGNTHSDEVTSTSSLDRRGQGTTASVGGGRTIMSTLRRPLSGHGGWRGVRVQT